MSVTVIKMSVDKSKDPEIYDLYEEGVMAIGVACDSVLPTSAQCRAIPDTLEFRANHYVVYTEDAIIGFIDFNTGYIARLYIKPEYQKRGYGKKLIDFAIRHFEQDTAIYVDTLENELSRKICKDMGFEFCGKSGHIHSREYKEINESISTDISFIDLGDA